MEATIVVTLTTVDWLYMTLILNNEWAINLQQTKITDPRTVHKTPPHTEILTVQKTPW